MINIHRLQKSSYSWISLSIAVLLVIEEICVGPSRAVADSADLETEMIALERICPRLLGRPVQSEQWRELVPYLQDPKALKKVEVICSGECSGALDLRNGIELRFSYPNVSAGPNGQKDEIVNGIELWKDGKNLKTFRPH
jgi:hypothetical protein